MKSPARDVLVEDSVVRQGNGLVVGTSDPVAISNISFRNCTTLATHFGCHIKFKDQQSGHVSGVVFEDISIVDPSGYAIGIDQDGQSLRGLDDHADRDDLRGGGGDALQQRAAQRRVGAPSNVTIDNILFRRIHARLGRRTHRHHGTTHTIPYGPPQRPVPPELSRFESRSVAAKRIKRTNLEPTQKPTDDVSRHSVQKRWKAKRLAGCAGGLFTCNPGPLACRGIDLVDVNLTGVGTECVFENTFGEGTRTEPASCVPPKADARAP